MLFLFEQLIDLAKVMTTLKSIRLVVQHNVIIVVDTTTNTLDPNIDVLIPHTIKENMVLDIYFYLCSSLNPVPPMTG